MEGRQSDHHHHHLPLLIQLRSLDPTGFASQRESGRAPRWQQNRGRVRQASSAACSEVGLRPRACQTSSDASASKCAPHRIIREAKCHLHKAIFTHRGLGRHGIAGVGTRILPCEPGLLHFPPNPRPATAGISKAGSALQHFQHSSTTALPPEPEVLSTFFPSPKRQQFTLVTLRQSS